jgi:hypothetical protein
MTLSLRARALCAAAIVAALALRAGAVTRLPSADGQFWDIQDTSAWSQDSGGIATGGRANPFNGFGYLKLRVRTAEVTLAPHRYLTGFGLAYDGSERLDSITPVLQDGILVARALFAPRDADYLRYVDSFTNTARTDRMVDVAWGGAAGNLPIARRAATLRMRDDAVFRGQLRNGDTPEIRGSEQQTLACFGPGKLQVVSAILDG